ncbi:PIG-L family deacetylase [uncultured Roseobacter sp.]|uniref:PIG-L deacetylase family protein n=1 Tax=uncultured Roseobacter sp. TaxID=114847 RepID=UPI00262DED91|nr:PIG-L family deacetylase [uncultured Roseobacter sp.]
MISTRPKSVTPSDLTAGERILVLAPHPDDETLGCGALLVAAFATTGAHVICMTDGARSHPQSRVWPPARLANLRAAEMREAISHLGGTAEDLTMLGEPDGQLNMQYERYDEIAQRIVAIAQQKGIRRVFASSTSDAHHDHKATASIARIVASELACTLFSYPVWSRWDEGDLGLDCALDTSPYRARKARALFAHRSQLGKVVHDDPDGFVMPERFVEMFVNEDELYREENP